mgnify:CR=1 FL=1
MTRKIKFKVWDKEKKKMGLVVGNLYMCYVCVKNKNKEHGIAEPDMLTYAVEEEQNSDEWITRHVRFPNFELMQFTGLKDKNGKEIYEGDVVLDIEGKNKFRNDYQVLEIGTKEGAEGRPCILPGFPLQQRCTVYDLSMETQRFKIIGNIYQDSHLLNSKV